MGTLEKLFCEASIDKVMRSFFFKSKYFLGKQFAKTMSLTHIRQILIHALKPIQKPFFMLVTPQYFNSTGISVPSTSFGTITAEGNDVFCTPVFGAPGFCHSVL